MVFCGKPSKGCANCRKRRIKCDQLAPSCSQCLRANKKCEGYRDQLNLMFRDENAKVVGKARIFKKNQQMPSPPEGEAETQAGIPKQIQETPSPPEEESESQARSLEQIQEATPLPYEERYGRALLNTAFFPVPAGSSEEFEEGNSKSIALRLYREQVQKKWEVIPTGSTSPNSLPPKSFYPSPYNQLSTEDIGIKFFLSHYLTTMEFSASGTHGQLPGRTPMAHQVFLNKSFGETVASIGYAGLFNVTMDPQYRITARKLYAKAMRSISGDLINTSKTDLDTVFKNIVLLAIFEIVSGTPPGLNSWGIHLDGAAALLKVMIAKKEGPQIHEQRMRLQFLFAIYSKSLNMGQPCPESIVEWSSQCLLLLKYQETKKPHIAFLVEALSLAEIFADFTNLHADIMAGLKSDPRLILQTALGLNSRLQTWESRLSSDWAFKEVVKKEDSVYIYDGMVYEFRDLWTCRVFNHSRFVRILVNELMMICLGKIGILDNGGLREMWNGCLQVIEAMSKDICRSVECQFRRYTLQEMKNDWVPVMSGCFLHLFPLAVAGSARGIPESLHNWIITLLDSIGRSMGIAQACIMIGTIKKRRERWLSGKASILFDIYKAEGGLA